MKFKKYRFLSAVVLSGVILATFGGCGEKNNSSSVPAAESSIDESQIAAVQKPGLKFTYGEPSTSPGNALDNPDPTAPVSGTSSAVSTTAAVVTVTDSAGSAVTEVVNVTDAAGVTITTQEIVTDDAGQAVTEAGGQTVTTVVNVTETAVKTETVPQTQQPEGSQSSGNNNNNTDSSSSSTSTSSSSSSDTPAYQANMKTFNAMWLDVSESKNYTFNDTFIEVKVTINEDIPDGKYPINITWPDFACYDPDVIGKTIEPDHTINGYIYVNVPVENQDIPSDGFVVIAENVEAKQGGEAVLKFDLKNNPGLCAVNFNFDYDENAIKINEAYAVGEFEKISGGNLS